MGNTQMKKAVMAEITVPSVRVDLGNKNVKTNAPTLNQMIQVSRIVNNIDAENVINDFMFIGALLLWAAQTFTSAKITLPQNKGLTRQKMIQQSNSHGFFTNVISKAPSARVILALAAICTAINTGKYEISERQLTEEEIESNIQSDFDILMLQKGHGTTKTFVRDDESRINWLKGTMSSMRSTWCTMPVFSPSTLITANFPVNSVTKEVIKMYKTRVARSFIGNGYMDQDLSQDIELYINGIMNNNIFNAELDDSAVGNFPTVKLDELFTIKRKITSDKPLVRTESRLIKDLKRKPRKIVTNNNKDNGKQ